MEQQKVDHQENNKAKQIAFRFIVAGLICLSIAGIFGLLAAIQFSYPEFLPELPFYKTRPIHVGAAVGWIFLTAIGGVYYYLETGESGKLWSPRLASLHFYFFLAACVAVFLAYLSGHFGGREYLEFPPIIALIVLTGWIFFAINVLRSLPDSFGKLPVYFWMWCTGAVIFLVAYSEAYLWLLPYFGRNVVRDLTVQWKSYGALVASWNMLIYGTAICLMNRIHQDDQVVYGNRSFFLYFIGITNSLFNWGHHTYVVPAKPWVSIVAYSVSMLELIILFFVVTGWIKSLQAEEAHGKHAISCRFILSSDVWVMLNLVLALAISVPAINFFTHGTHITVAHSMGSTIGINSMILFASLYYIFVESFGSESVKPLIARIGRRTLNLSLALFWACLIGAGVARGLVVAEQGNNFPAIQQAVHPFMQFIIFAGLGVIVGLFASIYALVPFRLMLTKSRHANVPLSH